MIRVKICGITRSVDAGLACELGADAIGFIFYSESPRCTSIAIAQRIASSLPAHVARVGVFVSPKESDLRSAVKRVPLDAIQLHGPLPAWIRTGSDIVLIRAVHAAPNTIAARILADAGSADAILLDGYRRGQYGGTGRTADVDLAKGLAASCKLILAGGLGPENVARLARDIVPYALDINSGIESRPGQKDAHRMQKLFDQLKEFRRDWSPERKRLFPYA